MGSACSTEEVHNVKQAKRLFIVPFSLTINNQHEIVTCTIRFHQHQNALV